ncbi:MAG TPA: hypothetical protein VML75_16145 [Kofleriaceae bacterium]|nr:hypothetical protein [Kofleriaceae bacterium]
MSRSLGSLVFVVGLALGGCGGGSDSGIPQDCNPLGGTSCLMPWPSAVYQEEANTASGHQLAIPVGAMPVNIDGRVIDPTWLNRYDGFGPSGVILAAFPTGVAVDGLPPHSDPDASLAADSPIILVNVDTGDRVAFFAEVDMNTNKPELRTLIIHPLERMAPASRYAVGIRDRVVDSTGQPLPRPEAFQALLDGTSFDHPLFAKLVPRYPAIFAALEAQGVQRDELVVAWDFVTASHEFLTRDLMTMRDAALPVIGANGANLSFDAAQVDNNGTRVLRFIVGTHDAPNFLTDGEKDLSILRRGADGLPELDGTYAANFAAIIPKCVETAPLPIQVMVFGHGLFGDGEDSLESGLLQRVADDYCFVTVAGDFIGLTGRQFAAAAFAVNDVNRGTGLTEKLAQSVINFIALEQLVRGPLRESDLFKHEGAEIIDPTRVHYFGASLGGIMGNVFMAYDPNVMRGALGVPGGSWSLMFERSFAWGPLQGAVIGAYEDQRTYQQVIALLGLGFEPYDPITTAGNVINDPLPGVPAKQILMYEALGDSLVSNLATEMVARTMGLPITGPSIRVPFGAVEMQEPMSSAFTIYNEHPDPLPPTINVPPSKDNGTHGDVNERDASLRQIERFFNEGTIINECQLDAQAAPCDCDTGACGEHR